MVFKRIFGLFTQKEQRLEPIEKSTKIQVINDATDFESAITATGFGKFNYILLLLLIPAAWTSQFESSTMSFVFPAAQCDLDLSLDNKGLLNAITYSGMIISGFAWGAIVDTFGRKKIMVIGYLLDGTLVLLSTFSQNFTTLIIFKFLGGLVISGPFTALTTYLSEFHSTKYRARVQLTLGAVFGLGNLYLPMIAYAVLPLKMHFTLFNGWINVHSWNILMALTSLCGLFSGIAFIFMPESPKYLMNIGENERALEIFQKVYKLNTGKPAMDFPITKLVNEVNSNQTKTTRGWSIMKPLFKNPYIKILLLVGAMQTLVIMSVNTLRLWMPQIFQAIHEYQVEHNGTTTNLCKMLEVFKPDNIEPSESCSVNLEGNFSVYVNSMIIALVQIVSYFMAGSLINSFGKKKLLMILATISAACVSSVYFSQNTATTLALTSINLALANVSIDIILTVIVVIFPTSLRAMAIAVVMVCGRGGSILGNIFFPILLQMGCAPPFVLIGCLLMCCVILSVLLPETDSKSLE